MLLRFARFELDGARFELRENNKAVPIEPQVLSLLLLLAANRERLVGKDEIVEIYLNDIYLGHSGGRPVLGVDEAARMYFGKLPARLRVDEAALLAGIVRAPNRDTPEKRPDIARGRRDADRARLGAQGRRLAHGRGVGRVGVRVQVLQGDGQALR